MQYITYKKKGDLLPAADSNERHLAKKMLAMAGVEPAKLPHSDLIRAPYPIGYMVRIVLNY